MNCNNIFIHALWVFFSTFTMQTFTRELSFNSLCLFFFFSNCCLQQKINMLKFEIQNVVEVAREKTTENVCSRKYTCGSILFAFIHTRSMAVLWSWFFRGFYFVSVFFFLKKYLNIFRDFLEIFWKMWILKINFKCVRMMNLVIIFKKVQCAYAAHVKHK